MTIETRAAPNFLYYALVDGTNEVDSVAFAANLTPKKGFGGWRNLLNFLDTDPFEPSHLVDGAHIFLPIIKLGDKAKPDPNGVAVVCPGGREGIGHEDSWKTYEPTPRIWQRPPPIMATTQTTHGRHTAAEESAECMQDFILSPAVQVDSVGVGSIQSGRPVKPDATVFRASLLYVSSHGWLGGFMKGEAISPWADAQPTEAKAEFVPFHSYMLIGRVDVSGKAFAGPVWVVLAQCSTVNTATWALWARVMARSTPPVRGLLGYEESSPAAGASVGIANAFFAELRAKKDFLSAWRAANPGQHWAAIVHKDAHKDTLTAFPTTPLPATTLSDYIGYIPSVPRGTPISDPPPPFKAQLFRIARKGQPNEVEVETGPDSLDLGQSSLRGGAFYLVRLSSSQSIAQASIRFVHIRRTFAQQFGHARLWANVSSPTAGVTIDLTSPNDIVAKASPATNRIDVLVEAHPDAKLNTSGLHASHSFLWLAASITHAAGAAQSHDFKTLGLLFG